jgi:hypothetical protein
MRWFLAACAAFVLVIAAYAQVQYARGQNVAPVFEGWERNPDGTFSMVFGYLNRNYEEELDLPVGPGNTVDAGEGASGDRGQPTHFYPRRQRFLFRVVVPKDWDKERKVIWTITSHGRTDQAKGWLQPVWELSADVIIENMGGGVPDPNNQPPALTIGDVPTVTLPEAATLTANATDDGLPKPYRRSPSNPDRDSISRTRQSYVRSGCLRGGVRSARGSDIEGEFRRGRHLCFARDRQRRAVIYLARHHRHGSLIRYSRGAYYFPR